MDEATAHPDQQAVQTVVVAGPGFALVFCRSPLLVEPYPASTALSPPGRFFLLVWIFLTLAGVVFRQLLRHRIQLPPEIGLCVGLAEAVVLAGLLALVAPVASQLGRQRDDRASLLPL